MKANLFNTVKLTKPKKNSFDLSHDVKMSAQMGNLTPILTLECVPGDSFNISCESLIRFAPMIAPVMHRMDVTMHYFFVPNRILWPNWEKFITDANSGIVAPFMASNAGWGDSQKRFADYMGIPPCPIGGTPTEISALPFAAYLAIWNEYYRDQNLISAVDYKCIDGDQQAKSDDYLQMRQRAWEHDYFTSCLPFAQKGAAVDLPLGSIPQDFIIETAGSTRVINATGGNIDVAQGASTPPYEPNRMFAKAKGTTLGTTTINDLRRAFKLQEWLEKNARGGTRYVESILSHFGVKSSDKRLQRPEYITGVKSPVIVSEVLNTTGPINDSGVSQGNMSGHGISVSSGNYSNYYCEEHGYIIGVMSIMPKTAYQQGIPRTYLKNDTLDYYFPSFANIGEQEVALEELYAYTPDRKTAFGYIPRYSEYKYMPSRVAGDFRKELDYWHLGRIFANQPALNADFIRCKPADTNRIFAVEDDIDNLYCHIFNKIQAVRPMPKFGNPSGL